MHKNSQKEPEHCSAHSAAKLGQLMYFLIVLFPRLLGWSENIFFSFRENLTQDITRNKHQWTNKYKKTEKKRKNEGFVLGVPQKLQKVILEILQIIL